MSQKPTHPIENIAEFANRFGRASQLFQSLLEERLAQFGLTPAQHAVLAYLSRRRDSVGNPMAQGVTEIARALGLRQPAVTKTLAKFAAQNWITQAPAPHDRRGRIATITADGRAHLAAVQKQMIPDLPVWFSDWSGDDLAAFTRAVDRFADALDARRTPPAP